MGTHLLAASAYSSIINCICTPVPPQAGPAVGVTSEILGNVTKV